MQPWRTYIERPVSIYPLITFRVVFGLLMFISTLRFVLKGWVQQLYIDPQFFFTYYGFHWVTPLPGWGMYTVFALMGVAALGIALGWRYRWSAAVFFLCFNYIELLDKSNYLNHYYFVSIISFLLLLLPAGKAVSIDVLKGRAKYLRLVPAYTVLVLQLQLAIVYFYAGLAKLNPAWLFEAMPLSIWLPAHAELPVLGPLMDQAWTAYAFSWGGAIYDLSIPFLLWFPGTRTFGFAMVVVFHLLTRILFPIGMFPYIMIGATLVFFSAGWHEHLWKRWEERLGMRRKEQVTNSGTRWQWPKAIKALVVVHLILQLLLPWRYLLYPGNIFWTEEGYRFSWRVMLMEKAGYVTFFVEDPSTGNTAQVDASTYLLPHQEKMMATQPDMILQFAHHLKAVYLRDGIADPRVRAEARVTLNGRPSQPFIDPGRNLAAERYDLRHRDWVLPLNSTP